MMYGSWDIKHNRQNGFVILDYSLPFYSPNNSENQSFEKKKKTPGDIITWVPYMKNENLMMYDSWDKERNRQIFFHFDYFLPFYRPSPLSPLTTHRNKILKKWKKLTEIPSEILSFYTSVPKIMIICYAVPEICCVTCKCYFSFWAIFCSFTPLTA